MSQFVAELRAEREQAVNEHAAWAGQSLAAVLVAAHTKVETLEPEQVESFRKRYQVAKDHVGAMLQAAKDAFAFEMSWQYAHE
jgi:hypothetical protein